jgi:malate synthase
MNRVLPIVDLPESPPTDGRAKPESGTTAHGAITRAGFFDSIDRCVRHLAARLGGADAAGNCGAECARVQLWQWLHAGDARLDDGTPITFALFDGALQRVGERLPRRGLPGQDKVMQAAWLLAELTHARTLTPTVMLPVERSS